MSATVDPGGYAPITNSSAERMMMALSSEARLALIVVALVVAFASIIFLTHTYTKRRCPAMGAATPTTKADDDTPVAESIDDEPPAEPLFDDAASSADADTASSQPHSEPQPPPAEKPAEDEPLPPPLDLKAHGTDDDHELPSTIDFDAKFVDDDPMRFPIESAVAANDDDGTMCYYTGGTPNLLVCPWKK